MLRPSRLVTLPAALALALSACGTKADTPRPEAPGTAAAGATVAPSGAPPAAPVAEDGQMPPEAASASPAPPAASTKRAAQPAPAQPASAQPGAAPSPAASSSPARTALADMKELERNPGGTPVLPTVTVPPGPKHADLPGSPGPMMAMGPSDALVRIFLFSDFQCPVCKRVVEPAKALLRELPNDVQVVFMHNALEMHPQAEVASRGAIAAFKMGKFWEFHDKLFQNQRLLQRTDLVGYAAELGLDQAEFVSHMDAPETLAQIQYERGIATALGARGTPGLLVNGHKQVGWSSYGGLKGLTNRALKSAKELLAQGVDRAEVAKQATKRNGEDGAKLAELLWGMK